MADEKPVTPSEWIHIHDAREVARMIPIPGDINSGRIPTNMVPVPDTPTTPPPSNPPEKKD